MSIVVCGSLGSTHLEGVSLLIPTMPDFVPAPFERQFPALKVQAKRKLFETEPSIASKVAKVLKPAAKPFVATASITPSNSQSSTSSTSGSAAVASVQPSVSQGITVVSNGTSVPTIVTVKKEFKSPMPGPTGLMKKIIAKKPPRASGSRSSSVSRDNDETDDDDDSHDMNQSRFDSSLNVITKKFFELFKSSPEGIVDLNEASTILQVPKRRIYDITNVLEGIGLTKKKSKNRVEWINKDGSHSEELETSDEERALNHALEEVEKITLSLFKSERKNLYVRPDFLNEVESIKSNTIICVKKRADTKLIVYPSDPTRLTVGTTEDFAQSLWLVPTFLWPDWTDRDGNEQDLTLTQDQIKIEEGSEPNPEEITIYSEAESGAIFDSSLMTNSELSESFIDEPYNMDASFISMLDPNSSPDKFWNPPVMNQAPPELLNLEPFDPFDFNFGMEFEEEGFSDVFGF